MRLHPLPTALLLPLGAIGCGELTASDTEQVPPRAPQVAPPDALAAATPTPPPAPSPAGAPPSTSPPNAAEQPVPVSVLAPVECEADADCGDAIHCNGLERCESGRCAPGAAPVCSSEAPYCDELLRGCGTCPPEAAFCDDFGRLSRCVAGAYEQSACSGSCQDDGVGGAQCLEGCSAGESRKCQLPTCVGVTTCAPGDGTASAQWTECNIPFEGSRLEDAMRQSVGIPAGPIAEALPNMKQFGATGLLNLAGLECASGLVELRLNYSDIEDFAALVSLQELDVLSLDGGALTSLLVLPTLPTLRTLIVSSNPLASFDIPPFPSLEVLDISFVNLPDFSTLPSIPNLRVLRIGGNLEATLGSLPSFPTLERLVIQSFDPLDVERLPALPALRDLFITVLDPIDLRRYVPTSALRALAIDSACQVDFGDGAWLAELTELYVTSCALNFDATVSEPIPLPPRLPVLERLDLSFGLRRSVADLPALPSLRTLNLSENEIQDILGLQDLPDLVELDLSGNPIADVDALVSEAERRSLEQCAPLHFRRVGTCSELPTLLP